MFPEEISGSASKELESKRRSPSLGLSFFPGKAGLVIQCPAQSCVI